MKTAAWLVAAAALAALAAVTVICRAEDARAAAIPCGTVVLIAWAYLAISDHMEHRR